jgi:hypothetical protein
MDENDNTSLERGASNDITRYRWRLKIRENIIGRLVAENERLRTLATHATPSEGSVQGRCIMGITLDDLNAQRAMLARGEEKRKAAKQAEERERLRDTFAAAALTGLLADQSLSDLGDTTLATRAYELASAMTEERDRIGGLLQPTLTDAEREAVEWYANFPDGIHAATLRNLLERLK